MEFASPPLNYSLHTIMSDGSSVDTDLDIFGIRTLTQSATPSGTLYNGDRWINTDTGKLYTYTQYGITGGTASFWVEYK